ncbi:unnamed protein product [Heligmosomoides polygyrus]|uniref:G_PROTEIN_RECEP_F1_2 domain-containing protein n=1 Tax=Heligmosomoides polygyrus TaxID=6339 RepID=A0A3P8ACQ7_HELPZ|nr:unnamed protein product [Heligmosomoides polygyrus]
MHGCRRVRLPRPNSSVTDGQCDTRTHTRTHTLAALYIVGYRSADHCRSIFARAECLNWDSCECVDQWTGLTANRQYSMTAVKTMYAFSFRYNGVLTSILVALGLVGSLLLLKQIHSSHVFSKRLAIHLGMICIWDSLYLLACLATYGVPSLLYGMIPVYGVMAYILFLLQPFASFCVSCTIWQVFAITLERYLAVSKPLEQRALTARFSAGWLCATIAAGAFVLNLLPVPFERQLVPCFEIVGSHLRNHTLLKPFDDSNSRLYRFVVHFFPDLIFRAPLPIIFIGTMTVRTIHACNQRNVGSAHLTLQINRNIPLRLYLLNFKFILCNTLYMFNTILLELLGYGEKGLIDRYMNSFYLTDASNMLLVLHSATNWLLFYKFPMMSRVSPSIANPAEEKASNYALAQELTESALKAPEGCSMTSLRRSPRVVHKL